MRGKILITQRMLEDTRIASQDIIQFYSIASNRYFQRQIPDVDEITRLVVYLKPLSGPLPATTKDTLATVIMDQKNERFMPHVLPVFQGTVVRFLNSDSIYHNVFSLSAAKSFDLGRYPKGQFRAVKFGRTGVVNIYCDIHTEMNAFIIVLDTPYFTLTDEQGEFILENIPPGEYDLGVWYGRWPARHRRILVRAGKTNLIEMSYP